MTKVGHMSSRLDRSWSVIESYQTFDGVHCVDVFSRPNGTFGYEEFRRDPEDMGAWTPIGYFSVHDYGSRDEAFEAARERISWLGPLINQ